MFTFWCILCYCTFIIKAYRFKYTRHAYEKNEPTLDYSGGGGCTVRPAGSPYSILNTNCYYVTVVLRWHLVKFNTTVAVNFSNNTCICTLPFTDRKLIENIL